MSDDFRRRIRYLLITHREGSPIGDCTPCERSRVGSGWPAYRDHMVNLIDAERHEAEMSRVRPSVKQFAELLAEHAYVSIHPGKLACNTCLDGKGGGEFATTREWAEHVDNALRRAGLRVGGA